MTWRRYLPAVTFNVEVLILVHFRSQSGLACTKFNYLSWNCILCYFKMLLTNCLDYKLDDDYIQRFLGKLSPKEENQLIKVSGKLNKFDSQLKFQNNVSVKFFLFSQSHALSFYSSNLNKEIMVSTVFGIWS